MRELRGQRYAVMATGRDRAPPVQRLRPVQPHQRRQQAAHQIQPEEDNPGEWTAIARRRPWPRRGHAPPAFDERVDGARFTGPSPFRPDNEWATEKGTRSPGPVRRVVAVRV